MASPLTVTRNDYRKNKKPSTIYTPVGVAQFLFELLAYKRPVKRRTGPCAGGGRCQPDFHIILDPAIGSARLTEPWRLAGRTIIGVDAKQQHAPGTVNEFILGKFEDLTWTRDLHYPSRRYWPLPDLVLCNPPFNGAEGKRLYPEVFLEHVFKLFGPTTPVAIFVPMGFRLNQRRKSKRFRWLRDCGADITSIISLPLDTFPGVEFHAEIVIFNVAGIKPHYFLPENAL